MEHKEYTNDDVIDLRELVQTIKKRKKLVYAITGVITLLAALYAFMLAKPVYEVKAMIEMGKLHVGTKSEIPLDNLNDIKQKLEYMYGVKSKKRNEYPRVKSISVAKNSKSIFGVTVEGRTNKGALSKINMLIEELKNTYADKEKTYIDTQKNLISLTQKDIETAYINLKNIENTLIDYNKKTLNITQNDAALAGLYTIQISQNQTIMQNLQSRISTLKSKEFDLKLSISPLRITPMHIVGKVEVLNKPIKPKKALIVIVAFITGLMLSIFVVFFREFLQGLREEK